MLQLPVCWWIQLKLCTIMHSEISKKNRVEDTNVWAQCCNIEPTYGRTTGMLLVLGGVRRMLLNKFIL